MVNLIFTVVFQKSKKILSLQGMREKPPILSRAGERLASGLGCLSEGIVVTRPDFTGGV